MYIRKILIKAQIMFDIVSKVECFGSIDSNLEQ